MHGALDSKPKPHGEELTGGCNVQNSESTASTGQFFGPSTEFVSEEPPIQNSKRSCLVLEIFSGSCRLSRACRDAGFRVTAVDKDETRAENFAIYKCDVTNSEDLALLLQYIEAEKEELLHVHFAPSCGTASRARERAPGPPPLRSDAFPDGLPGLSEQNKARVIAANNSYIAMLTLAKFAISLNISISIENPKNSLFWKCSFVREFLDSLPQFHICEFQHCMHGGKRDKFTHWLSCNPRELERDMFEALHLLCDRQHQHASWSPYIDETGKQVFPTASEAAYPDLLCHRIACILKEEASKHNFHFPNDLAEQLQTHPNAAKRQIFTTQPRGKRLRPLVSEFQAYRSVLFPLNSEHAIQKFLQDLPKGSRICHRSLTNGGIFWDDNSAKEAGLSAYDSWVDGQAGEILHFGIPREPEDFIREAIAKGHPRDVVARVPATVRALLKDLVHGKPERRFAKRAAFMKRWLKRSLELRADEERLHQQMPLHLRKILKGKRLLLLKEILIDLQYPDLGVVDDIISGFKLTGWAPKTGVFDPDVRRPQLSVEQLVKMAPGINARVIRSVEEAPADQTTDHVWAETWAEVDKGWLKPASSSKNCSVAKRFGLQQKSKIRMIDDFSVSRINHTYGMRERLRVQAVDELCAYLATLLDDHQPGELPKMKGRTFDLRSAYKQFGVDQWHSDFLQVCVKNPAGGHGLFGATALPFGATGSVTSFLRVSNAIAHIGHVGLDIVWSAFFDDYTAICTESEEDNVTFYIESLFRMLGIDFATEGDKAPPFKEEFKTLGLEFDLKNLSLGSFRLQHTESRRSELVTAIGSLLEKGNTTPKELERLHGRLVWFNAFVFGRKMNHAVRTLSLACHSTTKSLRLAGELREALARLQGLLADSRPLEISKALCNAWVIFTDGAYEPESDHPSTVGGVLISPCGVATSYFGEELSRTLTEKLLVDSQHPIYELEVLPPLLAICAWSQYISGAPVIFYLDNDAARSAYVQGVGATRFAKLFTEKFVEYESRLRVLSWFGRVPSHSNPSDKLSRLDFSDPLLKNCSRTKIQVPVHFEETGGGFGCTGNQSLSPWASSIQS